METYLAVYVLCQHVTPEFDPTQVDWNNPNVKYLMKHFEMALSSKDKEIAELRKKNEQLEAKIAQLEAKIVQLAGAHGQNNSRAPHNPGSPDDAGNSKPYQDKRSYNVREFTGYPRYTSGTNSSPETYVECGPAAVIERIADEQTCRDCGGRLSDPTGTYSRETQDLVDYRWTTSRWTIVRRYCKNCRTQQTAQVGGVLPGEHYGIDIMAQTLALKNMNISFGKIRKMFGMFYGAAIPRSTLNHFIRVGADRFEPLYDDLKAEINEKKVLNGDETGWFVNGKTFYVITAVGDDIVLFDITESRGTKAITDLLAEFKGIMGSDSHGAWNHVGALHQKCLLHYMRNMYQTLEKNHGSEFATFFTMLYCILKDAIALKDTLDSMTPEDKRRAAEDLRDRVSGLIDGVYHDKDCIRFVKRLRREIGHLFTFITHDIEYHNNSSERALRRFAEARKILYGSRTKDGARRTKILMSVYATCEMRGVNFYQFARDYLAGKTKTVPHKNSYPAVTA